MGEVWGVPWSLFVQDGGGPGNTTQIWTVCVKEPDTGRRLGGRHAWPFVLCQVGYPFLSSPCDLRQAEKPYKIEPSGSTSAPPFALRALQGTPFLQGSYVWKALSPRNLVAQKHFQVNPSLMTFHPQRPTWKRGRNGKSQAFIKANYWGAWVAQ